MLDSHLGQIKDLKNCIFAVSPQSTIYLRKRAMTGWLRETEQCVFLQTFT